jgi:glycosyltransferase involved in cell wall biosynthesis
MKFRIHWRTYTWTSSIPSFRYRCLIPALEMQKQGIAESLITRTRQDACFEEGFDVLVLVKAVSEEEVQLALDAKAFGRPVVLDLCDNLFFWAEYYEQTGFTDKYLYHQQRAKLLNTLGNLVDAIVVPTVSLQQRLLKAFPEQRVVVIPDALETDELREALLPDRQVRELARAYYIGSLYRALKVGAWDGLPFLYEMYLSSKVYFALRVVRGLYRRLVLTPLAALKRLYQALLIGIWPGLIEQGLEVLPTVASEISEWRAPKIEWAGKRNLLWFGNSGFDGVFGISELKKIEPELAALYKEHPFVLTVVSESDKLLAKCFPNPAFPIEFVEWSLDKCAEAIKRCDVVIIPNSENDFARHKSANRAVLALSNGKPVVASFIESLEPFKACILFDDFRHGITEYFENPELVARHTSLARSTIDSQFSPERAAHLWGALLQELCPQVGPEKRLEKEYVLT